MMAMLVDQQARTQTILGFKQMLTSYVSQPEDRFVSANSYPEQSELLSNIEDQDSYTGELDPVPTKKRYRGLKALLIFSIAVFAVMVGVFFVFKNINGKTTAYLNEESLEFDDYLLIPNYAGYMLDELDGKFDTQNFIIEIEPIFSAGEPEGKIISTSPPENSTARRGDVITLYVNMSRIVTMVDFTGLSYENAELALKELGIAKENYEIIQEETREAYDYTVYKQSVEPGEDFNVQMDILILTIAINPVGVNDIE
jgi:hypothetical protein